MGGKKGNRTKGNTRPSSSGRTAEMLSASGVTGFIGFTALSTEVQGIIPASTPDDVESTVDSDFRMVMKKITKRDSVTRVKALQEFSDLCQNKDETAVKGALPYWPRLFVKLAVDHDRRVRETTHQANKQLVTKVKKDLAPYLKTMMGTWIVSMCDPYAPAGSAAQEAFNVAFPTGKQPEALEFCKDEIFNFVSDILFQQTAKTLTDVSTSSPEEADSKYIRLLSSSLKGLRLFITTVADLKKEKTVQYISDILQENKFWKYANHKEIDVQIAWYFFIASFCQQMPHLSPKFIAKLAPLTLGHIDESHPVVANLVWEGTLHLLVTVQDCWQHVNVQKAVLPQLWKMLHNGGNGNADTVFKNLLPFLSKIPPEVCQPKSEFLTSFFGNFRQGLLHEKVLTSQSELKAVIQAFLECFRFVLLQNLQSSEEEQELRINLIHNHLLPIVELSFCDLTYKIQNPFFMELGIFLRGVECQLTQETNSEVSSGLSHILNLFWNRVCDLFSTVLASVLDSDVETKLKRFSQFFKILHAQENVTKPRKVAFSKESDKEMPLDIVSFKKGHPNDISVNGTCVKYTTDLCSTVLCKIKECPHVVYLNLLSDLVHNIPSKELFHKLYQEYSQIPVQEETETIEKFINAVLLHWLENRETLFGNSNQVPTVIVGIILQACVCLPQQKAFEILNDQCSMQDPHVLECLISKLISSRSEMPALFAWLKSDDLGRSMVSLASTLVEQIDTFSESSKPDASWKLLKICFTATTEFEPIIGVKYLNQILTILTSVLLKQSSVLEYTSGMIVFVCELAQSLLGGCLGCYQLTAMEDLLVCLFQLSCNNWSLSKESHKHVRDTWCMGTEQLVKFQGGFLKENGFLCKAAETIQDNLQNKRFKYNQLGDICIIEENVFCLLQTVAKNLPANSDSLLDKMCLVRILIDKILPCQEACLEMENELSTKVMSSVPPYLDSPLIQMFSTNEAQIAPMLITVRLLVKIINIFILVPSEEETDKPKLSESALEFLTEHLEKIYVIITYTQNFFVHPRVENPEEITKMFQEILDTLSKFQKYIATEDIKIFLNSLTERRKMGSHLFLHVFQTIFSLFNEERFMEMQYWVKPHFENVLVSTDCTFDQSNIWCLVPCATKENIEILFDNLILFFTAEETEDYESVAQYLKTLCCCLKSKNFKNPNFDKIVQVFKYLHNLKCKSDAGFLSDVQLTSDNLSEIEFSLIVGDFSCEVFDNIKELTEICVLDFVMCTLCGWINSLNKSVSILLEKDIYVMFARNAFSLLSRVKQYVSSEEAKEYSPDLLNEWKDLYFPTIFSQILPMFCQLCEDSRKFTFTSWEVEQMFDSLSFSLRNLLTDELLPCIENIPQLTSNEGLVDLCDKLYSHLKSDIQAVQWGIHNLLISLMPKVAEVSSKENIKERDAGDEDGMQQLLSLPVTKTLFSSGQIVDTMLADFHVEDCCLVKPFTDSYTYTLSYLLSWLHMLKIFSCSNSEVRSEYAMNFQNSKLLDSLLLNLFRLMPNNPVIFEKTTLFTEPFYPESASSASSKLIQKVVCHVYLNTLLQLPALVRHWWNKQDRRTADYVNKFTTTYISSLISLEEIKSVQETKVKFNNMIVKARPTAREVVAMYTMEDITNELVIKLPHNHPLGPVSVEAGQRIGVGLTQWRHWMLQLTTFLTHQNGSILDALSLWKRNVDKRFEGVEECMICFYVLHGSTCQLPRLTCKTCKKKFHSACLYKWFSTSQNASCPLCRNLF